MRRPIVAMSAVLLGVAGFLQPVVADEGAPAAVFPGFTAVDALAQGQLATGYLFAVGDELTRLVGAQVEINGPPAGSEAIAAFIQRGAGGNYVYGVAGGGGNGKGGALPQPPPGEADAFFPANPQTSSWEGPLTGGAKTQIIDGRFTSKATATPDARGDAAVTHVVVPGAFEIQQAVVDSHAEPTTDGVVSESVSVLHQVTIGPLTIYNLVSRAYIAFPALPGPTKAIANTIVDGATVNGTPVQITDRGLLVGPNASPGAQDQVNDAMAKSGFPLVRLTSSSVAPGPDGSARAVTGVIQVIHRDDKLGAQNPQGFQGGGFSVGGAEASVLAGRCAPSCGGPLDLSAPPTAHGAAFNPGPPGGGSSGLGSGSSAGSGYGSSSSSGSGLSALGSEPSGATGTEPATPVTPPPPDSSTTTPPGTSAGTAPGSTSAPAAPQRPSSLAATQLTPDMAGWMRDAYLAMGAALLILLLAGGLLLRAAVRR
ncbi:MAG TPA: hypothetical protein VH134_07400 [Candidatus Dormibacteraeota bacterium]|nr:hypothetical protein [Candidatus Dormibacteraeota bacterium]